MEIFTFFSLNHEKLSLFSIYSAEWPGSLCFPKSWQITSQTAVKVVTWLELLEWGPQLSVFTIDAADASDTPFSIMPPRYCSLVRSSLSPTRRF